MPLSACVRRQHNGHTGRRKRRGLLVAALASGLVFVPTPVATAGRSAGGVATRSMLVMLVDWTEPDAVTQADAANIVANLDDAWFSENSYGLLHTTGTSTPWMTIAPSDCRGDLAALLARAEQQAIAHGYDPASYDEELVYFPAADCGGWAGLAWNSRVVFLNGHLGVFITAHETGHTLGLAHSHTLACRDATGAPVPLGSDCTLAEQGDVFDTMGNSFFGAGHFNAAQKAALGWLDGRIRTVTQRAKIRLAPYETRSGIKAVAVQTGTRTYWLEYRQPIGADAFLIDHPGATDGVLVHIVDPAGGTDLLDMRPDAAFDFSDAALPAGASWATPEGAVIRVTRATATGATVRIRIPPSARAS